MKNKRSIIVFAISLVIVVGLVFVILMKEDKTICKMTSNQKASNYSINKEYTIYSSNDKVKKIVIKEELISKNNTIIAYFKKNYKEQYDSYNKRYKGYTYSVKTKDNKVISEVTIDFEKMDIKKFVEDNPAMKKFVDKDNKVLLEGMKSMYESSGATCTK